MKKTFTFLLIVFIGVSMLYGQTPHSLQKVTEGEKVFWLIDTPADFIWLCDTTSTKLDANNDGKADFDSLEVKMDANYRLAANIVFDPTPANVDWNNDGTINAEDALGLYACGGDGSPNFTGHFDGQYFALENVYKNSVNSARQRVALFGSVDGCIIENLHLKNFNFSNNEDYGGAITARANYGGVNVFRRILLEGTYNHSFRTSGSLHTGGIAGRTSKSAIIECVVIMTCISNNGTNRIGAVVGTMGDSTIIKNSYSVSTLSAKEKVGQVVGYFEGTDGFSAIENCYAAGVVTGIIPRDTEIGSFAGNLLALAPVSCYWDTNLDAIGVGVGTNASGVVGLATNQFSEAANFVGWDFTNTWKMGTVKGVMRPYLRWQDLQGGPTVSAKNIENRQLIKVYPNPVSTNLTIENAPVNAEYSLINLMGQTQKSGIVTSKRMMLNLEEFQQGIYLLKVGNNVSKIIVK